MNRNSLLGLIGVALLVFVVAFAAGRWTRPTRVRSVAAPIRTEPAPESLAIIESESTRLLTAAQTEAYENDLAPPAVDRSASQPAPSRKPRPKAQLATAPDTATTAVAQTVTSDTGAASAVATESIAPKTVVAKDYVAIEKRQQYAAQLPKDLMEKGVEAKVDAVGEMAEVIILSSPAFDARSKDTVIKQVCIDLKLLGFKRVHITDGGEYTMHFGL